MTLTSVLSSLGSVGLFASRAFVTAFSVAAMLKWGPEIWWIRDTGLLQNIEQVPSWFTHDITVMVLGILAVLEIVATKSSEARALMQEADRVLKSGMAFVTVLATHGILSHQDVGLIREITAFQEPIRAGIGDLGLGAVTAFFAAWGVWLTSGARAAVLGSVMDADPEDDTMIAGLFSWAEDLWALFGVVLLILFPLVMLGITVLLLGLLAFAQACLRKREEKSKTICGNCGRPMYQCAVACPDCQAPNPQVHGVNWLGQSSPQLARDTGLHPFLLIQKQRCPVCASHLKAGRFQQVCDACGHSLFDDPAEAERYLAVLDRRLPAVLLTTAALSFIPVIGLIPAIIVYRIRLVSPLRRWMSLSSAIPTKWALRLLILILCWVHLIPGIGALAVPAMASVSYAVHRRWFMRQLKSLSR